MLVSVGKPDQNGRMESEKILEHETTLEHALDVARANFKEAQRLLDEAKAAFAAGDVTEDRVVQLGPHFWIWQPKTSNGLPRSSRPPLQRPAR